MAYCKYNCVRNHHTISSSRTVLPYRMHRILCKRIFACPSWRTSGARHPTLKSPFRNPLLNSRMTVRTECNHAMLTQARTLMELAWITTTCSMTPLGANESITRIVSISCTQVRWGTEEILCFKTWHWLCVLIFIALQLSTHAFDLTNHFSLACPGDSLRTPTPTPWNDSSKVVCHE